MLTKVLRKKIRGVKRFKVDGIKNHALSIHHQNALNLSVQTKNLKMIIDMMYDKFHHEIKKLISIALFVATENLAITKFPKLCQLLKSLNLKLTDQDLYLTRYGFLE